MMQRIDLDTIYSIMRQIASHNEKREVAFHMLTNVLHEQRFDYKTSNLRKILMLLHRDGKICPSPSLPFAFTVNPTEEELEIERKATKDGIEVTDDRIKTTIRRFYKENTRFPKPSEIEDAFWRYYGKPSSRDFTRKLRDMVESKILERTESFEYYFMGLTTENEVGLERFVQR